MLAAFTWSKSIDDDSDDFESYIDPYNIRLSRGLSSFDIPYNFTFAATYDLPWFRNGKALNAALQVAGPRRAL